MEKQIPQLQDISYDLATQRFISHFIRHITYHLMPTKHMQTSNNLFLNLYVITYNFQPICSTILARRAKNGTSYIYTTIQTFFVYSKTLHPNVKMETNSVLQCIINHPTTITYVRLTTLSIQNGKSVYPFKQHTTCTCHFQIVKQASFFKYKGKKDYF